MSAGEDEPVNSSCVHCSEKGRGHTERLLHTWRTRWHNDDSCRFFSFDSKTCSIIV